jgi:hypothetical protein
MIGRVMKTVEFPTRGGPMRLSGVAVDHCAKCGEDILDPAASRRIDSVLFGQRRSARRRKTA